jgi:hypothetical protein
LIASAAICSIALDELRRRQDPAMRDLRTVERTGTELAFEVAYVVQVSTVRIVRGGNWLTTGVDSAIGFTEPDDRDARDRRSSGASRAASPRRRRPAALRLSQPRELGLHRHRPE